MAREDSLRNKASFVLGPMEMRIWTKIERALKKMRLERDTSSGTIDAPLKVVRSVTAEGVKGARDQLRVLGIEREILGYAIQRLYKAETGGRINKGERDRLASGYKERMAQVKETISRSESLIRLYELEGIQADLVKLFNNHLDDLNMRMGNLRSRLKFKTVPAPKPKKKKRERRKRSKTRKKKKAEDRVEKIRAEVDKTLERLEQIEIGRSVCELCGREFKNERGLSVHKAKVHGG